MVNREKGDGRYGAKLALTLRNPLTNVGADS